MSNKPVIICVDDEKFVLDGLRTVLMEAFGDEYVVEIAEDGRDALLLVKELLANRQEVPVVISDYVMPDMKGDELLKHIRILSQQTLKIMLTGQANIEGVTNAVNEGDLFRYVAKPWNNEHLIGVIRQAIGEYLAEKQKEDRTQALLQAVPDLVLMLGSDGAVLEVHGPTEALLRAGDTLVGRPLAAILPEPQAAQMRAQMREASAGKGAVSFDYELEVQGGLRHFEVRLAACGATDFVAVVRDVTARVQMEDERQALLAQARRDAQIKTELLREVNHRVKNNLAAILGLIVREKRGAPAAGRAFVESSLGNLGNRIRGLLDVHQFLSDTQWAPVNVTELGGRVIRAALAVIPGDECVDLDLPASAVVASPRQAGSLALILNELTSNAVKHALASRERLLVSLRASSAGGWLEIEFRDDGPGYSESVLGGERTHVGLGLVRELVQDSLRGTLALENAGGAVARIRIPEEESDRT